MTSWLGVVSAAHVRHALALGIAQINHGKRAGLSRMSADDTLVYYSPTEQRGDAQPLRAFTAFGTIADDHIWQADEGEFKPYRRRVTYLDTRPVPLTEVQVGLRFTADPHWGYQLRRGLIQIDDSDANLIRARMER